MPQPEETMGPVATRVVFENQDVKVWETDVGPGEAFPMHHHAYDYVLFITSDATLELQDYGGQPSVLPVADHIAVFIPGGGTEKYSNVGKTRFTEVLVEVKRPRGPGQEQPAFEASAELAGRPPMPGIVNLLDNSRVRVSETVVEPGASSGIYRQPNDAAVYVLSGSRIRLVEESESGKRSFEEDRRTNSAAWFPGGFGREIVNLGNSPYRHVSVEVK